MLIITSVSIVTLLLHCLIAEASITIEDGSPIVTSPDGALRGITLQSRQQRDYWAFRGIKYGDIPGRFELAKQPEPWTDVVDATQFGPICPQVNLHTRAIYALTEDCLFLNVYVPAALKDKTDIPVMLWVHGGGFLDGAGSNFGADFFMDEDVILVTINYRLGILGFLNTGDGAAPANLGLKDMILALKWVQRNIGAFGGNPAKVTIFGESAGGVSVHLLMLTPAARGLFHAVIAQSGSAFTPWSVNPDPYTAIEKVASALDCPVKSSKTVPCLKEVDTEKLLIAMKDVSFNGTFADLVFAPSVESFFYDEDDYLAVPAYPYDLIKRYDSSKHLPLMVGTNEHEGLLLYGGAFLTDEFLMSELIIKWVSATSKIFAYGSYVPDGEINTFGETLKSIYFGEKPVSKFTKHLLIKMFTHLLVERGFRLSAEHHAHLGSKVYPYMLTYKGEFSHAVMLGLSADEGPTHADELQYLFPSLLSPVKNWPDLKANSSDEEFSKKLVKLWTSFATNGEPTATWVDPWTPLEFKKLESTNYPIMRLDHETKMKPESDYDFNRITHADLLFATYEKPKLSWRSEKKLRDEF